MARQNLIPSAKGPEELTQRRRVVIALSTMFILPFVLAGLAAPWAYRFLTWLDANVWQFLGPDGLSFRRVATRIALVLAVLLLRPAIRMAGLKGFRDIGLTPCIAAARRQFLNGLALGIVSMALVYAAGLAAGAYSFNHKAAILALFLRRLSISLVAALLIAGVEEPLFRGVLYGLLRRCARLVPAVMIASLIFAALHLMKPESPADLDPASPLAGFRLMLCLFDGLNPALVLPTFLTLLFTGITLCLLYERQGSLYGVIGLHAGWVWVMKTAMRFVLRNPSHPLFFLWQSNWIGRTYAGVIMALIFLAGTVWILRSRKTDAVGPSR